MHNPLRVMVNGAGCEVVFTLRRRPGMSEEDFDRDANAVARDLATLKALVEAGEAAFRNLEEVVSSCQRPAGGGRP